MNKTKVIVTLGKSSFDKESLIKLIKSGMNVARINMLHFSYDDIKNIVNLLREIDTELGTFTAIILNLNDTKTRTNYFLNNGVNLKKGQYFSFLCGSEIIGDNTRCSISDAYLYESVKPGNILYIDNGLLQFEVKEINGREIKCIVNVPGFISSKKQINSSKIKEHRPLITEKINEDIKFACDIKADFISVSSIRTSFDISLYLDKIIEYNNSMTKLLCNVENIDCVNNIDNILEYCNGVIISRGEMGITIPYEEIPSIQKTIINKCRYNNKISIVSEQILSSMIDFNKPTRSEVSDIITILKDNADGIMLTRATSIGKYPVEALNTLCRLLADGESNLELGYSTNDISNKNNVLDYDDIMATSIANMSNNVPTKAIIITAFDEKIIGNLLKYRPKANIIAVTKSKNLARIFSLQFGVTPLLYDKFIDDVTFIKNARDFVLENNIANRLDTVIVLTSDKNASFKNDTLKIMTI